MKKVILALFVFLSFSFPVWSGLGPAIEIPNLNEAKSIQQRLDISKELMNKASSSLSVLIRYVEHLENREKLLEERVKVCEQN